jgi:hypothetical protein
MNIAGSDGNNVAPRGDITLAAFVITHSGHRAIAPECNSMATARRYRRFREPLHTCAGQIT